MSALQSDVILERMMSLHPKVMDLTLGRVWRLLEQLGSPEKMLPPVIHIAGTNGKGSTLSMIRAGIEAAGLSAHAYTSPHLERFHERIRLAGTLITEDSLSSILDEVYVANGPDQITYFEITTCAALLAMTRVPADYTLLEVGLGGRLDATNVIDQPKLCVITPISIDHEAFLGNTITKIAFEKAGIIKKGVPVVVGPQPQDAMDAIEEVAEKCHSPVIAYGQHWHASRERDRLVFQDETGLCDLPLPALPGAHQIANAGMAIATLRHLNFGQDTLEGAVTQAYWPARMQRLWSGNLVDLAGKAELWLDGGHNTAAGEALATHLATLSPKPTYMVCGMLNTKDISGYLTPFLPHVTELMGVSIPNEINTFTAEQTVQFARSAGIKAQMAETVLDAIETIVQKHPLARILICGSLYLAGYILRQNNKTNG